MTPTRIGTLSVLFIEISLVPAISKLNRYLLNKMNHKGQASQEMNGERREEGRKTSDHTIWAPRSSCAWLHQIDFSIMWVKNSMCIAYASLACVSVLFHWKITSNMLGGGGGGDGVYPSIWISFYRLVFEMATTKFLCAGKCFVW